MCAGDAQPTTNAVAATTIVARTMPQNGHDVS
jgi:hypothetical protein